MVLGSTTPGWPPKLATVCIYVTEKQQKLISDDRLHCQCRSIMYQATFTEPNLRICYTQKKRQTPEDLQGHGLETKGYPDSSDPEKKKIFEEYNPDNVVRGGEAATSEMPRSVGEESVERIRL